VALIVETKSPAEQMQQLLLARILGGDYRPGERLSPDQIKTELGWERPGSRPHEFRRTATRGRALAGGVDIT